MGMEGDDGGCVGVSPLPEAMDALVSDVRSLLALLDDQILDGVEPGVVLGFAAEFEQFRNLLSLVDHRIVRALEKCNAAERFSQPKVARVLAQALRISPAEAGRRVAAAHDLGPRFSMLGEPLTPLRAVLAEAQEAGDVSPEQVALIVKGLSGVDRRGFDPAAIAAGERILTDAARQLGPGDLGKVVVRVVDAIDPDGSLSDERIQHDRRHLDLRHGTDGSWIGQFRLTGACGAKLAAILGPLAKPRVPLRDGLGALAGSRLDEGLAAGSDRNVELSRDERTYGQRMHDALEDVCDRILRSGEIPDAGGTPATVIVTISEERLRSGIGHGVTSDGSVIDARQVRDLADNAEIWLATLGVKGTVLDLGRTRRIASLGQTVALIARDGGCSFPGCDHPPEWCERHHIREWVDGGRTALDNLTLLCRYHHRHFERNGWRCAISADGIPEWRPPSWVDRLQRPQMNSRIVAMRGQLLAA